ncbi:TPA: YSIRK-type signal peptide-containing protein [Staphylococcus aureus]
MKKSKKRLDFLPNKLNKYSIRRFSVGTASILVGATLLFGINNEAHAAEQNEAPVKEEATTDFEVGNSIYLNILVKDIEEKSQNISQKFIVSQLEEQPWNAKEMTIKDPDGHLITLTQSNISDTDFEKLMKKTSKDY